MYNNPIEESLVFALKKHGLVSENGNILNHNAYIAFLDNKIKENYKTLSGYADIDGNFNYRYKTKINELFNEINCLEEYKQRKKTIMLSLPEENIENTNRFGVFKSLCKFIKSKQR